MNELQTQTDQLLKALSQIQSDLHFIYITALVCTLLLGILVGFTVFKR